MHAPGYQNWCSSKCRNLGSGDPIYIGHQTAGGAGRCGRKSVTLMVIVKNRAGTDLRPHLFSFKNKAFWDQVWSQVWSQISFLISRFFIKCCFSKEKVWSQIWASVVANPGMLLKPTKYCFFGASSQTSVFASDHGLHVSRHASRKAIRKGFGTAADPAQINRPANLTPWASKQIYHQPAPV